MSVRTGQTKTVPKLRFPAFKDSWRQEPLGKVFSFFPTNSLSRDDLEYERGQYRNIHYGDIHTKFRTMFELSREHVPFVKKESLPGDVDDDRLCREGDVIFADASEDYADTGKAIELIDLAGEKVLSGLHTIHARPIKEFKPAFLGHLLMSPAVRRQIVKRAQGAKVLGISVRNISDVQLYYPSDAEQKEVGTLLKTVSDLIENLRKQKEALERYKKGVMQKIFSQEIRFKDENGKDFPEWEEYEFEDIFISIPSKRHQVQTSEFLGNGSHKVVDQGKTLIAGYSNNSTKLFTDTPVIVFGDHTTALKYIDFDFVVGADGVKILKSRHAHNLRYLYYYLETNPAVSEGYKRHYSILKEKRVLVPAIAEQTMIADFLGSIDQHIENVDERIAHAEIWKRGLMQKMFV